MRENKGIWIVFVVVVVLVVLGLWWFSWNQPISTATPGATTTVATTGNNTNTGTNSTGTNGNNAVQTIDRGSSSVVAVANSIGGSAQFQALLSSTGVAAQLTGKGPYTIFVPTDGAISQMPAGTISGLSAAAKKRLVQYHIVSGRAIDAQAEVAGSIQALSGDALNFSYGTNKIPMVNSAILVTGYKASNGMVYVIDNVLVPPTKTQ